MTDEPAPLRPAQLPQQPGRKDLTEQVNPVTNSRIWEDKHTPRRIKPAPSKALPAEV